MVKLIVVVLLALSLVSPAVSLALPWQCEWAAESGKLSDWLICGAWLVIFQLAPDPLDETCVGCG